VFTEFIWKTLLDLLWFWLEKTALWNKIVEIEKKTGKSWTLFRKLFPYRNRILKKKGKSKRFFYGLLKTWVWFLVCPIWKNAFWKRISEIENRPERLDRDFENRSFTETETYKKGKLEQGFFRVCLRSWFGFFFYDQKTAL
jgi:hypothetical protein